MDTAAPAVPLQSRYADLFPELVVHWQAESVPDPQLVLLNEALAGELGLDTDWLASPAGIQFLVGVAVPESAKPVAMAYAGHQFGGYSARLGDGRALLLGELTTPDGGLVDVHLKGSGRTPFARGGDGLAALGPMLREYLMGEAMHALRIPTTRALAVLTTGSTVRRERPLPGAVLVRVATSHLRVGTVQYAASLGNSDLLRRLADHVIARHHPDCAGAVHPYRELYRKIVGDQAMLIADWMLVGFIHGVMNTDNMTLSGQTIDYGPCAFLERHDPQAVYSSIDEGGRYAYGNQPAIGGWNLARLAEAMLPLLDPDPNAAAEWATDALGGFQRAFDTASTNGMRAKLGLSPEVPDGVVGALGGELVTAMTQQHLDHTATFRSLVDPARDAGDPRAGGDLPQVWLDRWRAQHPDPDRLRDTNPLYVPRNHLVEEALAAADFGDLTPLHRLLTAVSDPCTERPALAEFARPAPAGFDEGHRTFCGT